VKRSKRVLRIGPSKRSKGADSDPSGKPGGWWRPARSLLGLLIGGALLYLSLRDVALAGVWDALRRASLWWLPPISILLVAGFWVRSLRWRRMFPPRLMPTRREAFDALMIGALGNNMMPGRLGDLLRGIVIGRHLPALGASGALASIVLEKVLDGLVVLGMLAAGVALAPLPDWLVHAGILGSVIFIAVLAGLLVVSVADGEPGVLPPGEATSGIGARVHCVRARLSGGLHGLQSKRRFAELAGWSLIIWGIEVVVLYLAFQVLALRLPPEAALVTVVLLAAGTMLPAAPGFVGAYQFFVLAALSIYQVPETDAFALGLLLNLVVMIMTLVAGIAAVTVEGGLRETFKFRAL
jgi:uncharacterized membrane protein YbhN (UPF0104 family)